MCMKKILLLPILFILSACQPSELERCIEAESWYKNLNEENLYTRISIEKEHIYSYLPTLEQVPCESYKQAVDSYSSEAYDCNGIENLIVFGHGVKETIDASMDKKYILERIKEWGKENGKRACHKQGIY